MVYIYIYLYHFGALHTVVVRCGHLTVCRYIYIRDENRCIYIDTCMCVCVSISIYIYIDIYSCFGSLPGLVRWSGLDPGP